MKLKKVDYKPHGYQAFSTEFILKHKSAGLFLECGLGKSVITLTAVVELMYNMFDISKVLVIAPLRVADTTWQDEIEKWEHLKYLKLSKILGSKKNRIMALYKKADVYTINRENVDRKSTRLNSSHA